MKISFKSQSKKFYLSIVFPLLFLVFFSCNMPQNTGSNNLKNVSQLPDFSLKNLEGKTVQSEDFSQKILVINFWATWCPPCLKEIPHLNELFLDFRSRGVIVLGISMDQGDPDVVQQFIQRHDVKYPVVMGTSSVGDDFGGIRGLPTTFIVDQNGEIIKRFDGYRPSYPKAMKRTVDQILG